MARTLRSMVLSMLLGFHNAWEQDDAALDDLAVQFRVEYREPNGLALQHPERCFFWNESSLLN